MASLAAPFKSIEKCTVMLREKEIESADLLYVTDSSRLRDERVLTHF